MLKSQATPSVETKANEGSVNSQKECFPGANSAEQKRNCSFFCSGERKEKTMRYTSFEKLLTFAMSISCSITVVAGTLLPTIGLAKDSQKDLQQVQSHIVNGTDIGKNVWPEVVYLGIRKTNPIDPNDFTNWTCTGTLLARETIRTARTLGSARGDVILTAAHCLDPDKAGRAVTSVQYLRGEGDTTGQITTNPQNWPRNPNYNGVVGEHDTALVFFNRRNGFTNGLPVCERQPNIGDQVILVGFGCNDYTQYPNPGATPPTPYACTGQGQNSKRVGTQIMQNVANMITFTGPVQNGDGTTPNMGGGDSGSPFIAMQDGINCIAAVDSNISFQNSTPGGIPAPGHTARASAVNLHNASSQAFLVAQLPGLDCDIYESNCTARFIDLYWSIYRRLPTAETTWISVEHLIGNHTTLGQFAKEFRTDMFSRVQPALAMFLNK
jgi:hypothetical protein